MCVFTDYIITLYRYIIVNEMYKENKSNCYSSMCILFQSYDLYFKDSKWFS